MPHIRFLRGTNFRKGESVGAGDVREATDAEARMFCEGYGDAVRVDGDPPPVRGMTTQGVDVEHRDPEVKPAGRRK
jgi:hypothetical protein